MLKYMGNYIKVLVVSTQRYNFGFTPKFELSSQKSITVSLNTESQKVKILTGKCFPNRKIEEKVHAGS